MYYWFIVNSTTGAVGANHSTYLPGTVNNDGTIAFDQNLVPTGCTVLGPYETLDSTQQAVYDNSFLYLYYNGQFISNPDADQMQLQDAKQSKTVQIQQAYQAEINGTFTSSATGAALVYSYSPESQQLWGDLFKAIDKNLLPSTAFPMGITLANGTVVSHTQAQLVQIEADIAAWKFPLYQKYQKLVTSTIPSATTIDQVNTITW